MDQGQWESTGGTGVFANVKARGKWSADLHLGTIPNLGIPTLIGSLTWDGKYCDGSESISSICLSR